MASSFKEDGTNKLKTSDMTGFPLFTANTKQRPRHARASHSWNRHGMQCNVTGNDTTLLNTSWWHYYQHILSILGRGLNNLPKDIICPR